MGHIFVYRVSLTLFVCVLVQSHAGCNIKVYRSKASITFTWKNIKLIFCFCNFWSLKLAIAFCTTILYVCFDFHCDNWINEWLLHWDYKLDSCTFIQLIYAYNQYFLVLHGSTVMCSLISRWMDNLWFAAAFTCAGNI